MTVLNSLLAAAAVCYLSVFWFSAVAGVMMAGSAKVRRRAVMTAAIWPWYALRFFLYDRAPRKKQN